MDWSRIKTILIWVFAVVNVFLLTIYFNEANTGKTLGDDVLTSTVEILKQNNITVDKEVIPKSFENVKVCSVENQYASIGDMLSGAGINSKKTTIDGNGFLYVADNTEEALAVLDKLALSGYKKEEINGTEYYFLTYENKMVFDSFLWIKEAGGKVEVGGKNWMGDRVVGESVVEIVSPAEILIDFSSQYDGTKEIEIQSITAGFYVGERTGAVKTTASPVWKIMLSDGQGFYYDMRNGDLL